MQAFTAKYCDLLNKCNVYMLFYYLNRYKREVYKNQTQTVQFLLFDFTSIYQ